MATIRIISSHSYPIPTRSRRLQVEPVDLLREAKSRRWFLYLSSFYFNQPVVNLCLLDEVVPRGEIVLLPDSRGYVLDKRLLDLLLSYLSHGHSVNIVEGKLGGVDERFAELRKVVRVSSGAYCLSSAYPLIHTIVDYADRFFYQVESGKLFVEGYPQWCRPAVYKGLSVPQWIRSGDHKKIKRLLMGHGEA